MTAFQSQLCVYCNQPSGVPPLDPWSVPHGARASLIVACGVCMKERSELREAPWLATRHPGEAPDAPPGEGQISTVMVVRWRGNYVSVVVEDGKVLEERDGWTTRGAAFEYGWRKLEEHRQPLARAQAQAKAKLEQAIHESLTADGMFRRVDGDEP